MALVTARLAIWILLALRTDVHAAAPAKPGPSQPADLDAVARLFREGQARFDTSDFDGAIALWGQAYSALPEDPALAPTRALLMANLAQAHVAAHGVGGDIEHLRHADLLFEQYLATIDPADTETRADVEAERKKIADTIAAYEREQAARAPAERVEPPPPRPQEPKPGPGSPRPRRYTRWERGLSIGGAVSITFGVALTGAMGTALWLRDEEERKGKARARNPEATGGELLGYRTDSRGFNRLAISTGATAAILAVLGVGLIGAAEGHRAKRVRKLGVASGPGHIGAAIVGRF